ncbi:MAG: cell division protein FtsL [Bacteroidetes bacterium]|nr:cell division protein FtsL [Bacteroidota bacterium]MBU2585074.1 cell division protein FtsL [Bacteroidota bacterium]
MTSRKISPLWGIVALVIFSGSAIFYVRNIILIDQLAREINEKLNEKDNLVIENKTLKATEEKLSVKEKIIPVAQNKLKMMYPREPAIVLKVSDVNKSKIGSK